MTGATRIIAIGVAATLGLTVAAIPSVMAIGEPEPVPFSSTLTLDTRANPQVTLKGTTLSQALTTNPTSRNACSLVQEADPSLLSFTGYLGATVTDVGFKNASLGVNEKISSVCNRVDALSTTGKVETLELVLTPGLEVVPGSPVLGISSASLDIEVASITKLFSKQRAVVEALAYEAGNPTPIGQWTVTQGVGECLVAEGSNCRLNVATPGKYFNRLTLTAKAGAFSLEGGTDSAGPSTFELVSLVDQVLDCDVPYTSAQGNATVEYIGNADGSECGEFGVTLSSGEEDVTFLKPLALDPDAQFIFDVTWTRESGSPEATVPTVKIDFENWPESVTPFDNDLPFCPSYLYDGGALVGVQDAADFTSLPDWRLDLDGKQYACLDDPRSVDVAADAVTITDKIYLIGDAKMRL